MDHSCFKCSQSVEDGIPFCTHCGAPQIRVIVAGTLAEAAHSAPDLSAGQHTTVFPNSPARLSPTGTSRWAGVWGPSALAAVIATILMALRLHPLVGLFSVGVFSVAFYRYRRPAALITAAVGVRIGALAGLIWFGISAAMAAIVGLMMATNPELRDEMIKRLQEQASLSPDPQQAQEIVSYFKTPAAFEAKIAAIVVLTFFAAVILAGVGGALTGTFLRRRNRP